MKPKQIIALVAALLCFVSLLLVLFVFIFKGDGNNEPKGPSSSAGSGEQQESGEEGQGNPPAAEQPDSQPDENNGVKPEETPEETPDVKPETPPVETPDNEPDEEFENNTTVDKPSSGKLNPNPKTKEEIEAVLNDPYMILVNRDSKVSSDYVPNDLVTFPGSSYKLNRTCSEALNQLVKAGRNAGYSYVLYSGYRTYSSQYNKYYNKIDYWKNAGKSEEEAIRLTNQYYAPPGASEHHTGLAADVCIPSIVNKYACLHEAYDATAEFKWFSAHAHEYGFILRYQKGEEDITGYNYEPWHFRYVGVDVATEIYNRGITFEEYIADLQQRLAAFQ